MSTRKKRFVFTAFETVQYVNFEKLEKVCDKLFVLIHQQEQHIPLSLVLSMQEMGTDAKWVVVRTAKERSLDYHMAYVFGKLDEKLAEDIEFVLLSEKDTLDPLIDFINLKGRSCLRVTIEDTVEEERTRDESLLNEVNDDDDDEDLSFFGGASDFNIDISEGDKEPVAVAQPPSQAVSSIRDKAQETVERLKYTGNRPAEVVLLKDYISLFHQGIEDDGEADLIINKLVEEKQIEIRKGTIIYNF